jgi:hypothetical protein
MANTAPHPAPTCDDYIGLLERHVASLKSIRAEFSKPKSDASTYENSMITSISSIETALEGVRHTFVPLIIPQYLQLSPAPPAWLSLSAADQSSYSQVSAMNDYDQKALLAKFKKPGMRSAGLTKAARALGRQQNAIKDSNAWRQLAFLGKAYTARVRPQIAATARSPRRLKAAVRAYVDSDDFVEFPAEENGLQLFLMQLFDEEGGPLSDSAALSGPPQQQAAELAAVCCEVLGTLKIEDTIGVIRPHIATRNFGALFKAAAPAAEPFRRAIAEAAQLIGTGITLADFGGEGTLTPTVAEAVREAVDGNDVDQIAAHLQEAANAAAEQAGGRIAGAQMIACVLVSEKLLEFPQRLSVTLSWCSDSALAQFTNAAAYVHALGLVLTLIPSLE